MNGIENVTNYPVATAFQQRQKANNIVNFRAKDKFEKTETDPIEELKKQREKEKKSAKKKEIFYYATQVGVLAALTAGVFLSWKAIQGMGQSKAEIRKIWQDLKGKEKLKDMTLPKSLKDAAEYIRKDIEDPELIKQRGGRPIRAILLHGPAGTGKTSFAMAIGQEFEGAKFAQINWASLNSEFSSVGERNLLKASDEICKMADQNPKKKIFVFLDEFDSVIMEDRSLNAAQSNQTLNVFKDIMENRWLKRDNIVVVAATNLSIDTEKEAMTLGGKVLNKEMLDRFRYKVFVPRPDKIQANNKFASTYKNCSMVGDTLKNASDKDLDRFNEFLTKSEHNVSFRTIEAIMDQAAHSLEKPDQKVELIDLIRTVQAKRAEIKYTDEDFAKLLKDLKISPSQI